jgi:hypothetical protein
MSPFVFRAAALAAIVLAGATPLAAPLAAQGARGEGVGAGGTFPYVSVFVATGGSIASTGDLNARLDTAKFFKVSNDAISWGGGVRGRYGRMIFGGEFATTDFGEEGDPVTGKTSSLRSQFYLAQAGYTWWAGRHLNVYPLLGVGAGRMIVTLSDRNGGGKPPAGVDPTFTDIVLHPNYSSKIDATYLLFEPAIGADWLVLRSVADRGGLTLGARLGKKISPNRAAWKLNGAKVVGGPDVGPDGTWFRFTAGIAWR